MKYDKHIIMINAWKFRRADGMSMSDALRLAWRIAKAIIAEKTVTVKTWFLKKKFSRSEIFAISTARRVVIERETQKAALVKWFTDFGHIQSWIPKACMI